MADERDPKVSRRYRELGAEEPPRELDQTILAAGRRATDKPHAPLVTPAGRHRWYFSLAAAAIVVLAVAVTVHVDRQQPDPESVASAPAPQVQKVDPPAKPVPPPVFVPDPKPRAPAPTTADSAGAAAGPRAETQAAPPAEMRAQRDSSAQARSAPAQIESPERWLERIAQLRKEGRHDEADKALAEFRKRYPEYKIPASAEK